MKEYSKEDAIKILYKAFQEKGERLEIDEIINNINEKKLFSKNELMNVFGTTKAKTIWEMVDEYYGVDTFRTEKLKQELIKEMQEMYKTLPKMNNKTVPRIFRNKMERFFGSWTEAMLQSGLKANSFIPHKISNERKDLILEQLISITLSERKIPAKSTLGNYKNIPDYKLFKDIYGVEWDDLIIKLDLEKRKRREFNKLSNNEVFNIFKNEMKKNKSGTLSEYSFNLSTMGFEILYYVERYEVNFKWMTLLMNNGFTNVKQNRFYGNDDLINVLTYKYLLNGRQLKALEINNDQLIPDVSVLMQTFQKGMYEIWLMVEENAKTYY